MSPVCPFDETGGVVPFLVSLSSHERPSDKALMKVVEEVWANGRTNVPSTRHGEWLQG
jgi:hypothetical protein